MHYKKIRSNKPVLRSHISDWYVLGSLLLVWLGCRTSGGLQNRNRQPDVSPQDLQNMMRVTNALWDAALGEDSVRIVQLSSPGSSAAKWVQRWESSYPKFFEATHGKLTALGGYFLRASGDTAIVEIRAPWRSCPPDHYKTSEGQDHYMIMFVPVHQKWRIADIWSDPC